MLVCGSSKLLKQQNLLISRGFVVLIDENYNLIKSAAVFEYIEDFSEDKLEIVAGLRY